MNRITGLLSYLQPVARYLASPSTELVRFLNQANSLTSTVAPVAHTSAQLFTDMATTFHAWTYLADVVSERTSFGFAQRSMLMTSDPPQPVSYTHLTLPTKA